MSTPLEKFQSLLRELFQFDCADLDFGIYRVMNQKRAMIEAFIEKDLIESVSKELKKSALKEQGELVGQMEALAEKIREDIADDAIDADGNLDGAHQKTKLGKQYLELQKKTAGAVAASDLEAKVFNHLWNFFSRYYDDGDFLSTRRYSRREKYVIPYNGEEVHFHWANRDQYYIKTGESFTDYQWKANDISILFKLVQAETEKDNVKADKKRLFIPRLDGVSADKKAVTIPFEYRGLTGQEVISYGSKNQQDAIIAAAVDSIPRRKCLKDSPAVLGALLEEYRKTGTGESVSRLEHHLRRYTAKNTRDYFIHKDLGGFLTRELDFFLKNEVLALDDLEAGDAKRAEGWFELLQTIRAVGGKIIAFVAQIENFQKRIFEKRKFVTETNYCFTLDRVPRTLWPVILKNKAQIEEWKRLYAIQGLKGYSNPIKSTFFEAWPSLMIDTKFFAGDAEFVNTLLAAQKDLEETLGGLLVHSDNFQGLLMLQPRFHCAIRCIYIDPPYNTDVSAIPYKNDYRHSSFASLIHDRAALLRPLLRTEGILFVSIDKHERDTVDYALDAAFGGGNKVEELIWIQNTNDGRSPTYSVNHEYVEVYAKNKPAAEADYRIFREPKPGYVEVMELIGKLAPDYPPIDRIEMELRNLYKAHLKEYRKTIEDQGLEWAEEKRNDPWNGVYQYKYAEYRDANGKYVEERDAKANKAHIWVYRESDWTIMSAEDKQSSTIYDPKHPNYRFYKPPHPITGKPCAPSSRGWKGTWHVDPKHPDRNSWDSLCEDHRLAFGVDEKKVPQQKRMLHEVETNVCKSVFADYSDGEKETTSLFGRTGVFLAPKHTNFVARLLRQVVVPDSYVLDCFGGSGSTAHAVLRLNREDSGKQRYVIIEVGNHFDTIIKPRMQKAVFSEDWDDGKPVSPKVRKTSGMSHAFKYLRLESYEDALGNIAFDEPQAELKFEDYALRYMLEFETRKSETLLNIEKLAAPFSYQLNIMEGGEGKSKPVDLPETFNYLLGLKVATRQVHIRGGKHRYLVIRGTTNPHNEGGEREVVVIWRDVTGWKSADFKADAEFVKKEKLTDGADEVFVNADGVIPGARVLDPVFKERMFAPVDA